MIRLYLTVMAVLFIAPALYVIIVFDDWVAILSLAILIAGTMLFLLGSRIGRAISSPREFRDTRRTALLVKVLFFATTFVYVLMYFEFGGIPLLMSDSEYTSSQLRAEFTKSDDGIMSILVYIKSMLTRGVLPILICWTFYKLSSRYFYCLLIFLSFLMVSAYEKAGLIWIYLPIFILLYRERNLKGLFLTTTMFLVITAIVSSISLRHLYSYESVPDLPRYEIVSDNLQSSSGVNQDYSPALFSVEDQVTQRHVSIHERLPRYQFHGMSIFGDSAFGFMMNRIVWIPYITYYDTLLYWDMNSGEHLWFGVNRHLAHVTGLPFADLEREVFRFQFGSGIGSTGNSNALYLAEAYIAFGFLGVGLFGLFLGIIVGYLLGCKNNIVIGCVPLIFFSTFSASLISGLISGGILVLIIVIHLLTRRVRV